MKIIIAGAYAIGTHLARLLSRSNEEITLIDESEERLASIGSDCDLLTMLGKPTSLSTLRDAGVADADLFIAVTPIESMNLTASILAKTYRDDYMNRLHQEFPYYDWDHNKGYPTKKHRAAIAEHGVSPYHRMTFNLLGDGQLSLEF